MQRENKTAFTILEVLLSAIIFVITIMGLFVTLNSVRSPVSNKENQLTATVFGKQVLEALRSQVNAGSYYSGCAANAAEGTSANPCTSFDLSLGTHLVSSFPSGLSWPSSPNLSSSNPSGLSYIVSCTDGTGSYGSNTACTNNPYAARKVDLSINWPSLP